MKTIVNNFLIILLFAPAVFAQTTVTGSVTEQSTSSPLPGVNVLIKGTSTGTTTDFDGNYQIEANNGDIIVFSYIGYQSIEITYSGQAPLNIQLIEDTALLDEIVIIGYGSVKKEDLTEKWAVENNSVDLVTSSLTLEHISDLHHIFSETNRVLSEKGLFFISELHPFKQYVGSQAKFETTEGTQELEVYAHHISDFLNAAKSFGFEMLELKEWFDDNEEQKLPRLISFLFRKPVSES